MKWKEQEFNKWMKFVLIWGRVWKMRQLWKKSQRMDFNLINYSLYACVWHTNILMIFLFTMYKLNYNNIKCSIMFWVVLCVNIYVYNFEMLHNPVTMFYDRRSGTCRADIEPLLKMYLRKDTQSLIFVATRRDVHVLVVLAAIKIF
jgi:hypothetical protein